MHFITATVALAAALSGTSLANDVPSNTWDKYAEERGFSGYVDTREDAVVPSLSADTTANAEWEKAHGGPAPVYHAFETPDATVHPSPLAERDVDGDEEEFDILSKRFADENGYLYHPSALKARDLEAQEDASQYATDASENFDGNSEEYSVGNNEDEDIFRRNAEPEAAPAPSYGWLQHLIKNKHHSQPRARDVDGDEETSFEARIQKIQQLVRNKNHPNHVARDVNDGSTDQMTVDEAWEKMQELIQNEHLDHPIARDEDHLSPEWAEANGYMPMRARDEDSFSPEWAKENGYMPLQARDEDSTSPEWAEANGYLPLQARDAVPGAPLSDLIKDKHHAQLESAQKAPKVNILAVHNTNAQAASVPASIWSKLQSLIKDKHHPLPRSEDESDFDPVLLARGQDIFDPIWAADQGYDALEESSSSASAPSVPTTLAAETRKTHHHTHHHTATAAPTHHAHEAQTGEIKPTPLGSQETKVDAPKTTKRGFW